MSHAEVCPICGGKGTVKEDTNPYSTACPTERICHGCGGRGWILIPDGDKTETLSTVYSFQIQMQPSGVYEKMQEEKND